MKKYDFSKQHFKFEKKNTLLKIRRLFPGGASDLARETARCFNLI